MNGFDDKFLCPLPKFAVCSAGNRKFPANNYQTTTMADKLPEIIVSAKTTNGTKTVIQTTLPAAAAAPAHFHTLFDETFTVLGGEITVFVEGQAITLTPGQSATVPVTKVHRYTVGDQPTTVQLTFEPGSLDFEKAMLIIAGAQKDKEQGQTSSVPYENDNRSFMAVIANLTNSTFVGEAGDEMNVFLQTDEGKEIQRLTQELLAKYTGS